jgi:hypothetical protein
MSDYQRPSAPLAIGGVLDDGLKLYRAAVKPLFLVSLVTAVVLNLPTVGVAMMAPTGLPTDPDAAMALLPMSLVSSLVSMFFYAALILLIDRVARHSPASNGEALGVGLRRGLPLFLGWLLYGLAVAGGTILLLVPGLFLAVSLSFLSYPLVLDGKGPLASLRESYGLVKGSWWRTAGLLTVAFMVALLPYLAVAFLVGLVTGPLMTPGRMVGWSIVNAALLSLCYAFVLPILLCMYYAIWADLRLRRGGADLEQRLEAVSA